MDTSFSVTRESDYTVDDMTSDLVLVQALLYKVRVLLANVQNDLLSDWSFEKIISIFRDRLDACCDYRRLDFLQNGLEQVRESTKGYNSRQLGTLQNCKSCILDMLKELIDGYYSKFIYVMNGW